MATAYYTDEMRKFVGELPNEYGVKVDISEFEDADGRYLVLFLDKAQVLAHSGTAEAEAKAQYLIDLRNGLIARGARATFFIGGDE